MTGYGSGHAKQARRPPSSSAAPGAHGHRSRQALRREQAAHLRPRVERRRDHAADGQAPRRRPRRRHRGHRRHRRRGLVVTTARYLVGDVFDRMAQLEDGSVDLIMTSPPFLALRSYLPADHPDKAKEIGNETSPAEYLDTLLRLTAEWGRLLAPHGSICVELGDTYAGSGGAGGDYGDGGLRDGQPRFNGSARAARSAEESRLGVDAPNRGNTSRGTPAGGDWPLDKSLCGIPALYASSLAYGRNLL